MQRQARVALCHGNLFRLYARSLMAVPLMRTPRRRRPKAVQSELPSGRHQAVIWSCNIKDKFGEESKLDVALFFDIGKGHKEVAYNLRKTAFGFGSRRFLRIASDKKRISSKAKECGTRFFKYSDAVPFLKHGRSWTS